MNKQDLKKDDYYYAEYRNKLMKGFCIIKGTQSTNRPNLYTGNNVFHMKNHCSANANIRLATPEEKHWLDECIRLNKFITKEEAIKSFIPEYVKCILKHEEPAGKIYDTKDIIKQEPMREINIKLDSRVYSLDEITKVINANYEKEDALEIINTIKNII